MKDFWISYDIWENSRVMRLGLAVGQHSALLYPMKVGSQRGRYFTMAIWVALLCAYWTLLDQMTNNRNKDLNHVLNTSFPKVTLTNLRLSMTTELERLL